MLNENALTAFLTLSKTGSFQQAASQMGVSNASLSRYIAQAEEYTRFPLFHRNRNNSKLTRTGQEFLHIAIALKADLDRYTAQIADLRETGPGTLLIGCGPLTTRTLILPALQSIRREIKDLRFKILVSAYGRPLDHLQSGQFDVFVGDLTYTPNADGIEIMVMEKQPVVFAAHATHEIHRLGSCSLKDVFNYPFASPHLHKHWKTTLIKALGDDASAVEKVKDLPQIESDDYGLLTELLSKPDFIVGGMRTTFTEHFDLKAAKEIPIVSPISWNICAARKTNNSSAALELFWDTLIELNTSFE
ncbi:LysR family transcriptional regulator [Roseovarius sp. EL26]|uniref:LysR family transcriptional regulator n=1 Tax=Roseovarius sp. EL26 TaxID=2126672 RepID=UPI000EA3B404|nr:LysR family transcriptional regulator [Roseovarius sp. EL26]